MRKTNTLIISLLFLCFSVSSQNLFEKGSSQIFDFAISESSKELIYPFDNLFKVIDLSDNSISGNFPTEVDKYVTRMQINSNDSLLIAGFQNGTVNIYDLNSKSLISSFQNLEGNISALAISYDDFFLAAASDEGELIIYDLRINQILSKDDESGFVSDMEFTPDNRFLVSGGQFGLKMINPNSGSVVDEINLPRKKWIRGIKIDSEKNQIYFVGDNGKIMLTNYKSNATLSEPFSIYEDSPWISDLDILFEKNNLFLVSRVDGSIRIIGAFITYKLKNKGLIYRNKILPTESGQQIRIAFSLKDKGLYLFNVSNMKYDAME